jgi:parvulin-like peptidyl-prolyl isomerase
VTRTPRRLVLASVAALLLLSGCGDAGSAPGKAASVGDVVISTSQLQGLVDRGLSDPAAQEQFGADRAGFQQQALSRLIRSALLQQAAEREQVSVSEGDVDDQIAQFVERAGSREALDEQAAQNGIAAADVRDVARDIALELALREHLVQDVEVPAQQLQEIYEQSPEYDQVQSRHILVAEEAVARKALADVTADRSRFEALAAELSIDPSKEQGGDLGVAGRGQFVPEFEEAIFGAEVGDVVLVQTQFGWHVVEVLDRQTTTLEQARPELRRRVLDEQSGSLLGELLQETAKRLGVEVNPRFGTYDLEAGAVVAADDPNGVLKPGKDEGAPNGEVPPAEGEVPPGGEAPPPAEPPAAE